MNRHRPQPLSSLTLAGALLLGSGVALQGCAAPVMVAVASTPLVGGVLTKGKAEIQMDARSITPEVRSTLAAANRLVFISNDPILVYAGEELEKSGHYTVSLLRENSGSMTPSERSTALRQACRSRNADVVFIAVAEQGRASDSTASYLANLAIGRVVAEMPMSVDLLRCRDGWSHTLSGKLKYRTGVFNPHDAGGKVPALAGAAVADQLLELAGKSSATRLVDTAPPRPISAVSPEPYGNGFTRQDIREAQRLLNSLGHDAGTPDGLLGPKTSAAIASFQRTAGISATGVLDTQTLDSLRQAAPTEAEAENFPVAEETVPGNEAKELGQPRTVISASNVATIAPVRVAYALVETELKASADPFSSTLTKIGKGRELKVLKDNGDWLHIQHDGREGYVFSEFISR